MQGGDRLMSSLSIRDQELLVSALAPGLEELNPGYGEEAASSLVRLFGRLCERIQERVAQEQAQAS